MQTSLPPQPFRQQEASLCLAPCPSHRRCQRSRVGHGTGSLGTNTNGKLAVITSAFRKAYAFRTQDSGGQDIFASNSLMIFCKPQTTEIPGCGAEAGCEGSQSLAPVTQLSPLSPQFPLTPQPHQMSYLTDYLLLTRRLMRMTQGQGKKCFFTQACSQRNSLLQQ